MVYSVLAAVIIVVALVVVLIAGRLLLRGRWFVGWLRGMVGFLLLSCTFVLALSAYDFYSYKQLAREQSIATLSFTQLSEQRYRVSLVDSTGIEQIHELAGELWQLDARIIQWHKSLAKLGLLPGYRLDRLSGRYFSLEEERNAERTVYQLNTSKGLLDVWLWLRDYGSGLSVVGASYGSATYLPMTDGALFSVSLSNAGLLAQPLNDRAKTSVESWQ